MRKWIDVARKLNEASPKERRHPLYVTVISNGPFVVARMPEGFMSAVSYWRAIRRAMKAEFGLLARQVHTVEGLADPNEPQFGEGDVVQRLEAAFNGSTDYFKNFHLFAWDDAQHAFVKVRGPV